MSYLYEFTTTSGIGRVVVASPDCLSMAEQMIRQFEKADPTHKYVFQGCAIFDGSTGYPAQINFSWFDASGNAGSLFGSGLTFVGTRAGIQPDVFAAPSSAAMELAFITGFGLVFMVGIWAWAMAAILKMVGRP